jgi:beta-lactamase class A
LNILLPLVLAFAAPTSPVPDLSPVAAAARAAEKDGMVVGVSVVQLESGRGVSHRGGDRFQMASVFKVPVAIAVLDAVESGALRLDQEVQVLESDRERVGPIDDHWTPGMRVTVATMVDVMLVDSDNTAADLLIRLLGGPGAVEKALVSRGLAGIRISLDERGMGAEIRRDLAALERGEQNGATPDAMAALLTRLFKGELLPAPATNRILDAMRRCATGDRRLRAGLPKGTEVRDKTGTLRACSNDVGILTLPDGTHLVVAVFTRGGTDPAGRDAAIASVARAAWQAFAAPR